MPAGETARLYAWFSAESACYGAGGYCIVQVLVDGNAMAPTDSGTAFDSTNGGTETSTSWESHGFVRISDTLAAGSHTLNVRSRTTSASATLRLDDWAFVVQRTKIS